MENDKKLHAYLNGTATQEELAQLKASPEYATYLKIAEGAKHFTPPEFEAEANLEAIREKRAARPKQGKVKTLHSWRTMARWAAVLCVLLGGYWYVNSMGTSVETAIAETQDVILPDGSFVKLNAASTVAYHKDQWSDHRQLKLTGEAFFEVTKGQRFSVETRTGTVQVLGTKFNVFARDQVLKVFCYEGLVSVAFRDTVVKLPAGNGLKLVQGKLVHQSQNAEKTPAWLLGESHFDKVSLATAIEELERQYPVSVKMPEQAIQERFSVTFPHNNLELAIQLICAPLNLRYSLEDDQITLHAKKGR